MSLQRNVRAAYLGQGWTALMGLAFIPVYIRYLGVEAWGLVGFMAMMQAWFALLDMGLAPTLSREMARFSAGAHSAQSIRNLLRSLETVYVSVALSVVMIVWLAAPLLASQWLQVERLPVQEVAQAITLMGWVLAARMAEQVYRGAILGLQQLVWLNAAQSVLATLRWGGAVAVLAWVSPTVEAFFLWQGAVSVLTLAVFAVQTYRWLPRAPRAARFDLNELRLVARYAGGMAVTTVLALLLTQVDKLLLSKLLPLDQFGYYTLAGSVSGALYFLVGPLSTAVAPRLTELVARSDQATLVATYHRASQWTAVFLIAPALVLATFSERVLLAWSGEPALAQHAGPLLGVLAVGTMLNGFMQVPYMMQLAHGWTGLAVRLNAVAVVMIVPAIFWAVPRYGSLGAAWVWLVLNAFYVLVGIQFMHRSLLLREKWRWYRDTLVLPLLAGAAASGLAKLCWPPTGSRAIDALWLVGAAALTAAAVVAATPAPRHFLWLRLVELRGQRAGA
ncbi:oligosaccharide flippase family protein [Rhodoferax sp.]|uniref:oligosaccharide flippase family protein n=1 Tax=Rhodoferax sp. TaxID=50421 RepID=UPI00276A4605|nr:oligosaccharide flippase family protein [Rhodoferax sp.]